MPCAEARIECGACVYLQQKRGCEERLPRHRMRQPSKYSVERLSQTESLYPAAESAVCPA